MLPMCCVAPLYQCVRTDRAGNSISLEPVSVLNRSGDGDPTGGSSAREGILGLGDKVEGMYLLRNTEKYDATGGEIPPYAYGEASLSPPVSPLCNVIIVRRTEEAFFFKWNNQTPRLWTTGRHV